MSERTIAAVSTPQGAGGIGVIRISGDDAVTIADRCFRSFSGIRLCEMDGYRAAYGEVLSGDEVIDEAVALIFRAPKSYTGEDVVELSVHGSTAVVRKALRAVLESGAVPAQGGEFTKRAFLNGKMDLTKAESVMGLISAKSDAALKISRAARTGSITKEIDRIIAKLLETAASIAAYSDFPDEDIEGLDGESFSRLFSECNESLTKLIKNYDIGKIVREGIECCIVGKPNVGKSTLMNMLCRSERSIVTDIAGTTRDIVENSVMIGDIILNLSDTAGIHDTEDVVESFGVERALERLHQSALVLAVFDGSSKLDNDDRILLEKLDPQNTIIVINKTDLEPKISSSDFKKFRIVQISAKNNEGYDLLVGEISDITQTANLSEGDTVLVSERQRDCAAKALSAVSSAKNAFETGVTLDAVGVCLDDAISELLSLTGKRVTNEVCDEIFRRFCVGK